MKPTSFTPALRAVMLYLVFAGAWLFVAAPLLEQIPFPPPWHFIAPAGLDLIFLALSLPFLLLYLRHEWQRRKKSETALRESEARLQSILASLHETIIIVLDREGRHLAAWGSPELDQRYGLHSAELMGRTITDISPAMSIQDGLANMQNQIAAGKPWREEIIVHLPNGDFWHDTTFSPMRNDRGEITTVVGVIRDITELKRTEAALRESEARYRTLAESAQDMIFIVDRQYQVQYINAFAAQYVHRSPNKIIGEPVAAFFPPDIVERQTQNLQTVFETGQTIQVEAGTPYGAQLVWQNTALAPIRNAAGEVQAVLGISRDITAQKQAEAALRESESRYKKLVGAITNYIYTVIIENGCAVKTHHGPGCVSITGYTPEEYAADPYLWHNMIDPDDREAVTRQANLALAGEDVPSLEHRLTHKDGTIRWIRNTLVPRRDVQGRLVSYDGLVVDITERKRAELALRESEERYRQLAEISPDAITLTDLTGKITWCNEQAAQMYGLTVAEAVGQMAFQFIVAEERQRAFATTRIVLAQGRANNIEYTFVHKDGGRFPGELNTSLVKNAEGKPAAFIGVTRDITERKRAEAAQQQYAQRLEELHQIDRAILASQSPEAIAQEALRRLRQLVPCQRASITLANLENQTATILAIEVDGQTQLKAGTLIPINELGNLTALQSGQPRVADDLHDFPPSISLVKTLLAEGICAYANVPLIVQGQLIGTLNLGATQPGAFTADHVSIAREVAASLAVAIQQARLRTQVQRHAAELEQRVTERTAQLQTAVSEMEAFTYSMSHDLRAPLRAMQGFADALLVDYADRLDKTGQDYALRITAAAHRLDLLIQDLLAYSRLSRAELHLKPASLTAVLHEALTQLEIEIKARQAEVMIEKPLPHVLGHPVTLLQIITNLLSNAVKFVPPGTHPRVRVWVETRANDDNEAPPWVRLWVEDNGLGIAPEHHERIFRVFERLHGTEAYPGTGIGLALVRKGVERMGGRVGLESALGAGSRFWLELPLARISE